jgi:hypothetical protein
MAFCWSHAYNGVFPCPWPDCQYGHPSSELKIDGRLVHRQQFGNDVVRVAYAWVIDSVDAAYCAAQLTRRSIALMNGELPVLTDDGLFYHFTSAAGLTGILESGELWLTEYLDLADRTELRHGVEVAERTFTDLQNACCTEVRDMMARLTQDSINDGIYVGCMSLLRDSPIHWQEYAGESTGAAIAMEPMAMCDLIAVDPLAIQISRVAYTWDSKAGLFANFAWWFDEVARFDIDRHVFNASAYEREMRRVFHELLPLCKDVSFQREHEARIIIVPAMGTQASTREVPISVRDSPRGAIRYVGTRTIAPKFRLPIQRVWVGPGFSGDINRLRSRYSLVVEQLPL